MNKITLFTFTLIALLGTLLAACSGGAPTDLSGEWKLVSYGDAANPTPAIEDVESSLSFGTDGKFGGTVGCNSFGADYTLEGESVRIGAVVSTMMFCDATSAQETAVLGILSEKELKMSMSGSQLTLTSADGASVVVLERK